MRRENTTGRSMAMLLGGLAAGVLGSRLLPPMIAAMTGSSRARGGADAFGLLIEDHRQIQSLLTEMATVPTNSAFQRGRLFLMLKRKLAKHALAEEDVIYPIVHNNSVEGDQSKHLYDEHADMKIFLYEIETRLKAGEDWRAAVDSLRDLVRRHVQEEEQTIFPRLREQLAGSKLPTVSGQISREEALIL
jgi:hemerythrin superfamily protein